MKHGTTIRRVVTLGALLAIAAAASAQTTGNIDPIDKWAWAGNAGWISFGPLEGGASVYPDHLEGYIWLENLGWARLGTTSGGGIHAYGNTSASDYGVNNDGSGQLSGFAWSTTAGWISFDPPGAERVTIDPATGSFDGFAWAENVGWLHFKNAAPAYNVVTSGQVPVEIQSFTIEAARQSQLPLEKP